MADSTTKDVSAIKREEIVLDQNLQPVKVIGCNLCMVQPVLKGLSRVSLTRIWPRQRDTEGEWIVCDVS